MTESPIDRTDLLAALSDIETGDAIALAPANGPAANLETPPEPTENGSIEPIASDPVSASAVAEAADDAPPVHVAGNSLIAIDELDAVLAEIDDLPPEKVAAIPSLDQPATVESHSPESPAETSQPSSGEPAVAAANPVTAAAEPAKPAAAAPAGPTKGIKFVIGRKAEAASGDKAVAAKAEPLKRAGLPETPAAAKAVEVLSPEELNPRATLGKRVYRVFDGLLEGLNRPFQRMNGGVRGLIGVVSLTTIVLSMSTALALPLLWPHRDAVAFVQEKRSEMDNPKPKKPAGADEKSEHGHGETPKH